MSKKVKNAMLTFIEFFKKHGIAKYEGENVLVAAEQLLGVCKRLDAVKALTEEHVHDILTGLSIVNVVVEGGKSCILPFPQYKI